MKRMKKVLAGLLAATMAMSMSVTAFADTATHQDMSTVTVTKTYNATNEGTISPAETFTFSELSCTGVTNAGVDPATGLVITKDNAPKPTIGNVSYASGEAGSAAKSKDITIKLPEYKAVGIYTYNFKEIAGDTAGVTYNEGEIELVVTVIEQNGKIRVAAVHTEDLNGDENAASPGNAKTDDFDNVYSAGSLVVKKNVTGILGDKEKEFTVKVTFTAPEGDKVKGDIAYTDGTEDKTIDAEEGGWTGSKVVEITLKHDESVTFTNIPYGVTYTVVENDYTAEDAGGYDKATYIFDDNNKKIDSASENVEITNNKGGEVDTGIILDSAPYILLLAFAAMGVFALVAKKREEEF